MEGVRSYSDAIMRTVVMFFAVLWLWKWTF